MSFCTNKLRRSGALLCALCMVSILFLGFAVPASATETDTTEPTEDKGPPMMSVGPHGGMTVEWYDESDTLHYFGLYWYANANAYSRSTAYPVYISWDNGIVVQFDPADFSNFDKLNIWEEGASVNKYVESFAMSKVTYDAKTCWQYRFAPNAVYYGLPFSSLKDFRDALVQETYAIYYLENPEDDFSTAVPFSLVDLSGDGGEDAGGDVFVDLTGTNELLTRTNELLSETNTVLMSILFTLVLLGSGAIFKTLIGR